jgi:anti-anti-sigma factor
MPKVAISYRRQDSEAITGRIFDRLVAHFGKDSVFRDIDNIPLGVDFRSYIHDALGQSDVLLTIIGPLWTGPLGNGRARIDDETDLVRIEVQIALSMSIAVIPVLIANAVIPGPGQLPEVIKDLAFRNAIRIDAGQDFDHHMSRLIGAIQRYFEAKVAAPKVEAPTLATASAAAPAPAPALPDKPAEGFSCVETRDFGVTILTVKGRIDNDTSVPFQETLVAAAAEVKNTVLLDLSQVPFISSAGMAAIMTALRRAKMTGSRIAAAAPTPIVAEIFAISRFSRLLTIYPSLAEGKAALAFEIAQDIPPLP